MPHYYSHEPLTSIRLGEYSDLHMALDDEAVELERAISEGRVTVLGERGEASASKAFLARLSDLPPSIRRLALARACVIPWAACPTETPACFQWELARAAEEALEERGADPEVDAMLIDLFAAVPVPVSETVLRQVVPMTPTSRYFSLIFALVTQWSEQEHCPEWLKREFAYATTVDSDEYRAWRKNRWV